MKANSIPKLRYRILVLFIFSELCCGNGRLKKKNFVNTSFSCLRYICDHRKQCRPSSFSLLVTLRFKVLDFYLTSTVNFIICRETCIQIVVCYCNYGLNLRWGSIVATTLLIRGLAVPLMINQLKATSKLTVISLVSASNLI